MSDRVQQVSLRKPKVSAALAALAYAFIPLTIELTGQDTNPFYYNTVAKIAQVPVALVFLYLTARRYLPQNSPSISKLVLSRSSYLVTLHQGKPGIARSARDLFRMPLFWIGIGFFDYALFAWAIAYVDTAVASTIFEVWPVLFVLILIRLQAPDKDVSPYAEVLSEDRRIFRAVTPYQWTLICIAPIGLYFTFASRTDKLTISIADYFGTDAFGLILALCAAIATSIPPALTIVYGRLLQEIHASSSSKSPALNAESNINTQEESSASLEDQRLWYTVFGFAVALSLGAVLNFLVGSALLRSSQYVTIKGTIGGVILGTVLLAPASILLRKANHDTRDASVNGIFFFSPVLALILLAAFGIVLPRFDFFLMGASLILIVNILLQANPDSESDPTKLGADPVQGARMGFTSLILALWFFGSIIYLRDELFPAGWLEWDDAEYWGLLALSATVFALIFGFRVARLSGRIGKEDDSMLSLFRESERVYGLIGDSDLRDRALTNLTRLDRASPRTTAIFRFPRYIPDETALTGNPAVSEPRTTVGDDKETQEQTVEREYSQLFGTYLSVRQDLGDARSAMIEGGDELSHSQRAELRTELSRMESTLDTIAHSKQQGRDFSELISLTIFALITIALGVAAHPASVVQSNNGWTSFLTELFAMLFVSTIGFLAANLFDLRRDREMPLLVGLPVEVSAPGSRQYFLFFRHRRDLATQRAIAVLLTLGVCAVFGYLFYNKWL